MTFRIGDQGGSWQRINYGKPLEKDIQRAILDYLGTIGAYGGKTKTMGVKRGNFFCIDPYLFKGFPDISFFFRTTLYFCEVKRPGNYQSSEQKIFQSHCELSGIKYILVFCVEDVQKALRKDGHNV